MIYLNLGRREQGKTTLAFYLIRQYGARVIFDPRALVPGARVEFLSGVRTAFDRLHETGTGQVVITPDHDAQGLLDFTSLEVKAWIQDGRGPIALLVDEARMVDLDDEAFDWLLRCSTRAQIAIVITAHRPSDVPVDVRAISDVWNIFAMTQEHDLKVVRERCGDEVADRVRQLGPRAFVSWDDAHGRFTLHTDPARWYMRLETVGPRAAGGYPPDPSDALPPV